MKRREFLAMFAGAAAAAPLVAGAQQPQNPRIAYLSASALNAEGSPSMKGFREGLTEAGFVEGRTVEVVYRHAAGRPELLRQYSSEIAALRPAVIVAAATAGVLAAKESTGDVPIVFVGIAADPVAMGLAQSLARPGGRLTGFVLLSPELSRKRLEFVREMMPRLKGVAVLANPKNASHPEVLREVEEAAKRIAFDVAFDEATDEREIEAAFERLSRTGQKVVLIIEDPTFNSQVQHIVDLAAKHRMATVTGIGDYAERGGLMSYAPDLSDLFRRAAGYAGAIVKGAHPGDLPVQQPAKFNLVVNLKTAKALGIAIPQSLLLRADEVIE